MFSRVATLSAVLQAPMLYVYDPKALHHIVVKDQYVYEETPTWIKLGMPTEHTECLRLSKVFAASIVCFSVTVFYLVLVRLQATVSAQNR